MASINRRTALVGLGAAVGASALPSLAQSGASHSTFAVTDLIPVIGRPDGGVAIRWTDGVLTGHVDAKSVPLCRVLSQIFSRHRLRADGGFDTVVFELAYFTDLETRELLESWVNPMTGKTVAVPKTMLGPSPYVITPSLQAVRELRYSGGVPFSHRFLVESTSEDLWVTESLDSVMPAPAPGVPPFGFHENFTYRASRAAVRDRRSLDTLVQKHNVLSWRPWMMMQGVVGITTTRAYGRVIDDVARLPDAFQRLNARHGQGIVDDLPGLLKFEV